MSEQKQITLPGHAVVVDDDNFDTERLLRKNGVYGVARQATLSVRQSVANLRRHG